jgi:hypothetical protein
LIFLVYEESYLNLDETNQSIPSLTVSLFQEFEDVFLEEMSSGLSPIRGIEHQIDFVLEAIIPNRLAYIGVIRVRPRSFKGKLKIC